MKILPRLWVFLGLWALSGTLRARAGGVLVMESTAGFFISILAGILLALAFHFLLNTLGEALGISDIGKPLPGKKNSQHEQTESSADASPVIQITTGVGVAMTLAMSIALFCASLVAVNLSLVPSVYIGLELGLVIWAGYLLVALYIDARMLRAMTGLVMAVLRNALGFGAATPRKMTSPGKPSPIHGTVEEVVKALHEEVRQEFNLSGLEQKLDEYIRRLEPQRIDLNQIHDHLCELLQEVEIREADSPEDPGAIRRLFIDVAEKHQRLSDHDRQNLAAAFDRARASLGGEGSRLDKATRLVDTLSPESEKQAREYRHKVEQYLRDTGRGDLDPESLKQDLERIIEDPDAAPDIIRERVSQLDRATLEAALATRQGLSGEQARRYLDRGEQVLQEIRRRASQATDKNGGKADNARHRAKEGHAPGQRSRQQRRAAAEEVIARWFDRIQRPELQYRVLKNDLRYIMDDPEAAPGVLKKRLGKMNHESIVALVSNTPRISHEQAEKLVDQIEVARDDALRRADEIEAIVEERLKEARATALKQAETAHQTAADSAWWLFVASGVSAMASAAGGMLGGSG